MPFVDEERLHKALEPLYPELTMEEGKTLYCSIFFRFRYKIFMYVSQFVEIIAAMIDSMSASRIVHIRF